MDQLGEIVHTSRHATPKDYLGVVKTIKLIVDELDDVAGEVSPVGLGTPGAWIDARQAMKNCNSTAINHKPFLTDVQKLLNRPVRIANDADCMVVSEAADGAAAGAKSVIGVILGTGVGAGWVINGQLVQGPNGLAGEWGHNTFPMAAGTPQAELLLDPDKEERICYCGKLNCVETFLSGRGLELTYSQLFGGSLTAKEIGKEKTKECQQVVDEYIRHLALALTVLVNIADPEVVVLAGGVSQIERIYEEIPPLLVDFAFSSEGLTKIRPAKHGATSGRRGAAWLFPADD